MELRDQRIKPTLARKLGEVTHVSPLFRKVCELSGCSEEDVGDWLLKCAVKRGASHYRRSFEAGLAPDQPALTNEELGVALCLYHHPFNPMLIRAAAQLLSAADTNKLELARLAELERIEPVLLHIAEAAKRVEPKSEPWSWLREHLYTRQRINAEALPHWSRFVSQTGYTPAGRGEHIQWLTRDEQSPRDFTDAR